MTTISATIGNNTATANIPNDSNTEIIKAAFADLLDEITTAHPPKEFDENNPTEPEKMNTLIAEIDGVSSNILAVESLSGYNLKSIFNILIDRILIKHRPVEITQSQNEVLAKHGIDINNYVNMGYVRVVEDSIN